MRGQTMGTVGQGRAFRARFRKGILSLLVLVFFLLPFQPSPARAWCVATIVDPARIGKLVVQEAADSSAWATVLLNVSTFIDGLIAIYTTAKEMIRQTVEALNANTRALLGMHHVGAMIETKLAQALIDADTANAHDKALFRQVLKKADPKNSYLCKKILAHQMAPTTAHFAAEVSRMAAEGIANKGRCPTCHENGPDYIGKTLQNRCALKLGDKEAAGDQAACRDDVVRAPGGQSLAEADFRPLAAGEIVEMPAIETRAYVDPATSKSLTVSVPVPSTERQRFWMAQWNHIFHLVGPRPTPASGAALEVPSGKTQRALFNHCLSLQNALVKPCTDWLAYHTRPNCSETPALCERQKQGCYAAKGTVDLAPYDDCAKGLSLYEEQEIDHAFCLATQHAISLSHGGVTDLELGRNNDLCALSWTAWQKQLEGQRARCDAAATTMESLNACWRAVDMLGQGS